VYKNSREEVMNGDVLVTLLVAAAPFAIVFGLLAWAGRRERLRSDVQACQVALTDAVHARLGAVVAPLVRRRWRGWQVRLAVPFDRPAMTIAVLRVVLEVFAPREGGQRSLEVILTRQRGVLGPRPVRARDIREGVPSWT
jgi:hypothetical protein